MRRPGGGRTGDGFVSVVLRMVLKEALWIAGLGTLVGGNGFILHNAVRSGDAARCFGLRSFDARRRGWDFGDRNDSGGHGAGATRRHMDPIEAAKIPSGPVLLSPRKQEADVANFLRIKKYDYGAC